MKSLIILAFVIITCSLSFKLIDNRSELFAKYVHKYKKNYKTNQEAAYRFKVFSQNLTKLYLFGINVDNFKFNQDNVDDLPLFMDLTQEEFQTKYLSIKFSQEEIETKRFGNELLKMKSRDTIPDSFDWREKGAVTDVKDQGFCGSCWAFSTVGNLEGQSKIINNKMKSLSVQQLIDCDREKDLGCDGGYMNNAFDYINKNGGLQTDEDYPYKYWNFDCQVDKSKYYLKVNDFKFISKDEEEIKEHLYKIGPLSAGLNATMLQLYIRGILNPLKALCKPDKLDHGVLIVGYGEEKGKKYWTVKNSWGSGWGEKGYFRIHRGDGTCGINTFVLSTTIEKDNNLN